jgi:hypothetical protein
MFETSANSLNSSVKRHLGKKSPFQIPPSVNEPVVLRSQINTSRSKQAAAPTQ